MNMCRFDVIFFFELLWKKGADSKELNFWLPETLVFLNDRCTGMFTQALYCNYLAKAEVGFCVQRGTTHTR